MEKQYLTLSKIDAYMIAYHLSNYVWGIVIGWENFAKWTIGKQFTEAIDSVPANIAEGFGRYHKMDKIKFYRYAFGSLEESRDWTRKSAVRGLLTDEQITYIVSELDKMPKLLNQLVQYTNEKLKV